MATLAEIGGNSAKQLERNMEKAYYSIQKHISRDNNRVDSQSMNTEVYVKAQSFKFRYLKPEASTMLSLQKNSNSFLHIKTCTQISWTALACLCHFNAAILLFVWFLKFRK